MTHTDELGSFSRLWRLLAKMTGIELTGNEKPSFTVTSDIKDIKAAVWHLQWPGLINDPEKFTPSSRTEQNHRRRFGTRRIILDKVRYATLTAKSSNVKRFLPK